MLIWLAGGLIVSIVLAWLAAMLHASVHAPVGSVSIGVGLLLGVMLSTLATLIKVRPGKRLIVGAILLALVTVLAQHAWLYVDFRRQWHEARARSPEIAMFRPETPWSPVEYFASELSAVRVGLWCVDAAIITTMAVGTLWILERKRQ